MSASRQGFVSTLCVLLLAGCISTPDVSFGDDAGPVVVSAPVCGALTVPGPDAVPSPPLVTIEIVEVEQGPPLVGTSIKDYEETAIWLGHVAGWMSQAAVWIESARSCAEVE